MNVAATIVRIAAALLLGACATPEAPVQHPHAHAEVLLSTERGMRSIAFDTHHTYLSLSNSREQSSAVMRSGKIINRLSRWTGVELGPCALGPAPAGQVLRAPALARLAGNIYLFQPALDGTQEHSLCQLERGYEWFQPRDDGLRACRTSACPRLSMTDLQTYDGLLVSNAGAGPNLLTLHQPSQRWHALLGSMERHACPHAAFRVTGRRVWLGAACQAAPPYLRAYAIAQGGAALVPAAPLVLPPLDQRRVRFISQAVGTSMFAAVDGALLKSTDGGTTFRYVILHAGGSHQFPTIATLLTLRNRPQVLVAAGADSGTGKPYLALSADAGERWTDLSSILPGHADAQPAVAADVTSLAEDRAGRVLLTLNLQPGAQGRLVMLTLGGVD